MKVLLIGAGGHGQVVADVLFAMQANEKSVAPIGFLDDNTDLHGQSFLDLPVLGPVHQWQSWNSDALLLGIGDNQRRSQLVMQLQAQGARFFTAIHPSAVLGSYVEIGPGTVICGNVVVNTGSRIGSHVILNTACSVDHHNRLADYVHIAPGARLGGDVTVGEGALVGIGAIVLPQRNVGAWSLVGGGAVLLRDLPERHVAIGNPAKALPRRQFENR